MKWMHPEISLERWIQPSWFWAQSPGWKPGWKATGAAGGRQWTGWERVASIMLLAGSEMGWYLQIIIINDLQEVMSRTLIKCAHVAKWEIGGRNTRGRHFISRYLVTSFCDLACKKWLDFASPHLSLLSWAWTRFLRGATGEVAGEDLYSRFTYPLAENQGVYKLHLLPDVLKQEAYKN